MANPAHTPILHITGLRQMYHDPSQFQRRGQNLIIVIENRRGIIMVIRTIVAFSMGAVLTGIVLPTMNFTGLSSGIMKEMVEILGLTPMLLRLLLLCTVDLSIPMNNSGTQMITR